MLPPFQAAFAAFVKDRKSWTAADLLRAARYAHANDDIGSAELYLAMLEVQLWLRMS